MSLALFDSIVQHNVATLPTAAENVALDEALLLQAEKADAGIECLRLWELPEYAVIIGRASKIETEVNIETCRADSVPIVRRCTGGTTVVLGPGCLVYSVVLNIEQRPKLRHIDRLHEFVLGRLVDAVQAATGQSLQQQGICDLTMGQHKVSGNSLRITKRHVLYHGTLLCNFAVDLITRYQRSAVREPEYRQGRSHGEFVRNTKFRVHDIGAELCRQWQATPADIPHAAKNVAQELLREKYSQDAWNFRH